MSTETQLLTSFPMQSNFTGYDEYANPLYDRAVDALFYRNFWKKYFTNGVFSDSEDNFKVSPYSGFSIQVKLGGAHIQGVTCLPETETKLIIELSQSTGADRVDRIVLRADFEGERKISVEILEGWKPTDSLTRNSNIWELALADVTISKNSESVQAANITDLRLNSDLCGIVTEPIERVNSVVFFEQIQDMRENIQNEWDTQLDAVISQKDSQQAAWDNQMDNQAFEHASQMESQQSQWQSQMYTQEAAWATQTGVQQDEFDVQLDAQQENFTEIKTKVESWFNDSRADIANLQTFDFDNISTYPGAAKATVFREDGSIEQTLSLPSSQKLIAACLTEFLEDSSIRSTLRTYDENGDEKDVRITVTTFAQDGSILEEVV